MGLKQDLVSMPCDPTLESGGIALKGPTGCSEPLSSLQETEEETEPVTADMITNATKIPMPSGLAGPPDRSRKGRRRSLEGVGDIREDVRQTVEAWRILWVDLNDIWEAN